MSIIDIAIIAFVVMEFSNVIILYYFPEFNMGNGVYVFEHWEKSKEQKDVHLFARYMANWVAGVKLIFIVLLLVILCTGTETTKFYGAIVMILSIATYFWKLHPIMKELDSMGEIKPKGYSKTLGLMVGGFMLMFSVAVLVHLYNYGFPVA